MSFGVAARGQTLRHTPQESVYGPDRDTCPRWDAPLWCGLGLQNGIVLYVGEKMKDGGAEGSSASLMDESKIKLIK